jgi:hypothetical protein
MNMHMEAKGTLILWIPLFSLTAYDSNFKLVCIRYSETTENCGPFRRSSILMTKFTRMVEEQRKISTAVPPYPACVGKGMHHLLDSVTCMRKIHV